MQQNDNSNFDHITFALSTVPVFIESSIAQLDQASITTEQALRNVEAENLTVSHLINGYDINNR